MKEEKYKVLAESKRCVRGKGTIECPFVRGVTPRRNSCAVNPNNCVIWLTYYNSSLD